jgi:hypothetical protein
VLTNNRNTDREDIQVIVKPENAQQAIDEICQTRPKPSFKTQNRPIINLLAEFASFYNSARSPDWLARLEDFGGPKSEVRIQKDDYLSVVVLSLVQSFETYAKSQIIMTGYLIGVPDYGKRVGRLPRGKKTVDYLFNDLPNELHPNFPVDRADPEAAAFFRDFYKQVRNPLSHGDQLAGACAYDFLCFLEWYRKGYEWIASWRVPGAYLEFNSRRLRVKDAIPKTQSDWQQRSHEFQLRRSAAQNPINAP